MTEQNTEIVEIPASEIKAEDDLRIEDSWCRVLGVHRIFGSVAVFKTASPWGTICSNLDTLKLVRRPSPQGTSGEGDRRLQGLHDTVTRWRNNSVHATDEFNAVLVEIERLAATPSPVSGDGEAREPNCRIVPDDSSPYIGATKVVPIPSSSTEGRNDA